MIITSPNHRSDMYGPVNHASLNTSCTFWNSDLILIVKIFALIIRNPELVGITVIMYTEALEILS